MSNIRKAPAHFDDVQLLETSKSASPVRAACSPTMDIFSMRCKTEVRSFVAWIAASYYRCKNIYRSHFSAEIYALSSQNVAKVFNLIPTVFIQNLTFIIR